MNAGAVSSFTSRTPVASAAPDKRHFAREDTHGCSDRRRHDLVYPIEPRAAGRDESPLQRGAKIVSRAWLTFRTVPKLNGPLLERVFLLSSRVVISGSRKHHRHGRPGDNQGYDLYAVPRRKPEAETGEMLIRVFLDLVDYCRRIDLADFG